MLGPLLFLAYTIDLPNCVAVPTSCDQFADDTALTTVSPSPTECEGHLQRSVDATSTWLSEWKLAVNVDKTVSMEFTRRPFSSDFAINLNGNTLKKVRIQRTSRPGPYFRPAVDSPRQPGALQSGPTPAHLETTPLYSL